MFRNLVAPALLPLCLGLPTMASSLQARDAVAVAGPGSAKATRTTGAKPLTDGTWGPVVSGRLKNGLRFAILPRRPNESGVGLLMRIEGGFIAEKRPGERGLAHLIEHVAFVSPTSSAPGDLHHFLRIALPLTYPAPSAGTTSWRETNYFVATRTTRTDDIDTVLAVFREVAGDLILRADAVDEQRADVSREMAERKLGNDIYANFIAAAAPGSPNDVIDAQNSDDVPSASIGTIRALYYRLYRPENMMIVIVGNVDAAQIAALIERRFGGWHGTGPAPVVAPHPTVDPGRIAPVSYSAFEQGRSIAMMTVAMPLPTPPPTRKAQADAMLMDMLAVRVVNNRLAKVQPGAPPGKAGLFIENGEQGHRMLLLWDNFTPGQWRPATGNLKKLTCDLDTVGFSQREWAMAKEDVIHDLEQRTKDMGGVPNVELAKDLSHALAAGQALISAKALLDHARRSFPTNGVRAANDWWRQQWNAGVEHIRVESPELAKIDDPQSAIRSTIAVAIDGSGCHLRR